MTVKLLGIGLGGIAHVELKYCVGLEDVELVGGADIDPDARRRVEEEFGAPTYGGVADLLEARGDEADAAIIITPHTLHHEHIVACFEAGLHVFVEKPMVVGLEAAVDVCERAADRELVLQVGYQRHFHPGFREVKRIVDGGRIGEVHSANCFLGQDWIAPQLEDGSSWRIDPALSGGGQLYDSGSHLLDALLWVLDAEPKRVAALMDYRDTDVDINSALSATLERDGAPITASIGICGDGPSSPDTSEGIVIWGTEGRLEYRDGRVTVVEKGGTNRTSYATEIDEGTDFETLFTAKLENFVDSVRGTAEPAVPGEVGLGVVALTEAAYRADETERVVDVDELLEEARARSPRTVVETAED